MGYLYDKVRDVVGGNRVSGGFIKNWSPNSIKAMVITRDYIFVANHVKMPRVIKLDPSEVAMDLEQQGRGGALHNLLAQRQLSCMEEFYVDSGFMNYRGAIDVEGYIGKLINEKSRLRFYGYVSGVSADELVKGFTEARMKSNPIYAYALDSGRTGKVSYKTLQNATWYENHNLRPQYYGLDADGGELDRWFRRSEGIIRELLEGAMREEEAGAVTKALVTLVSRDVEELPEIMTYLSLVKYLKRGSGDRVFSCVLRGIAEGSKNYKRKVGKLKPEGLQTVLVQTGESAKNLARVYQYFGVVDKDGSEGNLEELVEAVKSGQGLTEFVGFLDSVLYETWIIMGNTYPEGKLLIMLESQKYKDDIPSGKFRTALGLGEGRGCSLGMMSTLLGVCGWNHSSFREYLRRGSDGKREA